MKNFLKLSWIIVFGVVIGFSISAQTNDEYVVVEMFYENGAWSFLFSNNNLNLASTRNDYYIALASVCNYMYRYNYVLNIVDAVDAADDVIYLIFRKKINIVAQKATAVTRG